MRTEPPPTPRRKHRSERYHMEGDDELMPSRRNDRAGSKKQSAPRSSRRQQLDPDGGRQIDPDGDQGGVSVSTPHGAYYEESTRETIFQSPNSTQTHSSSAAPSISASSSIRVVAMDWESRISDTSGILSEEDTRDAPPTRSRRTESARAYLRRHENTERREGDDQTVRTEFDNVIVSKIQREQHSSKDRRSDKKRAPTTKEEEASMASSIDDSSGILDADADLDNIRSTAENLFQSRRNKRESHKSVPAVDEGSSIIAKRDHSASTSSRKHTHRSTNRSRLSNHRDHKSRALAGDDASHADAASNKSQPSRIYTKGPTSDNETSSIKHKGKHTSSRRSVASPGFDDFHSLLSGGTSVASTTHVQIEPLRWTEQETDNLLMQLEFFGDNMNKDSYRLPQRSVQKVVNSIQAIVEKDSLRRNDANLQNLCKALHSIRMVDLDKLLRLLQENHKVGEMIQGKRVLLLCGPTGSGKTTTLHFLAGTTLEEVDEQGFFHLKPVQFQDQSLKDFETSCCRKHITKTMQATTVKVEKKGSTGMDPEDAEEEIVVCDTPAMGHVDTVEEEISNGLGMINQLQRAKSIHPFLLLSRETLGSRFGNLMEIINAMRAQFVLESKVDLAALNYLFTKYEGKHRTRICKQISVLEKVPPNIADEDRVIYKAFVRDIVKKTTPKAALALPMEEKSEKCLQDVWDSAVDRDGKDLMVPFASKSAAQKLKLQLQLTVYDFANLLAKGDYPLALHRLTLLNELAKILPDAEECAEKARQIGAKHVILVADLIKEMIDDEDFVSAFFQTNELSKLEKQIPEAQDPLDRTMKRLQKRVKHVLEEGSIVEGLQKMENLRNLASQLPQAKEFVQQGFDSILKRLLRTMETQDVEATLYQLEELSKVAHRLPEAGECAWHVLKLLNGVVAKYAESQDLDKLMQLMQRLCTIAAVFPDANECIQVGFDLLRNKTKELFDDKKYSRFIIEMRPLNKMTSLLSKEHKFVNRGSLLLQDTVIEIIDGKDYDTAVDLLISLQGLQEAYPEVTECVRAAYEVLLLKAVGAINERQFEESIDQLVKLGQLLSGMPTAMAPTKHGFKPLAKNVETTLMCLNFSRATTFIERLHAASKIFPEVQDAVELSFGQLLQRSTAMVTKSTYAEGLQQLVQLSKLVRKMSVPSQVIERGISELQETVQDTVEVLDFKSCIEFLQQLDKVTDMHPKINKFINDGFVALLQKAGQLLTVQNYSDALDQVEKLGEVKHKFVLTKDSLERGLTGFSITLNKFFQGTDFQKTVDILQHLFKVSRAFPETMRCVKRGYELLLEKAVDSFEQRRYSQALNEIRQLGQLFRHFKLEEDCNRGNLKYLAAAIPKSMQESDFGDALGILKELIQLVRFIPEINDCVHIGYESLLEKSIGDLSPGNSKKPVQQMKQLAQAVEFVPDIANSRSQGLRHLEEKVLATMTELEFAACKELLEDFNKLNHLYPEVERTVLAAYKQLQEKAAKTFEKNGSQKGIHELHQLGRLGKFLKVDKIADSDSSGSDLINTKVLGTMKDEDFETGKQLLESLHDTTQSYPQAERILQLGYKELQEKVAHAFDVHGYQKGMNMFRELLQLGALLQIKPKTDNDSRGSDLINEKMMEALRHMDFESSKDLLEDMHNLVQLHPEAKGLVAAGYKHLQGLAAMTFEASGCQKGILELKQLGKLRQHLDLKDQTGVDIRGSDMVTAKALEAMASLDFDEAVDTIEKVKKLLPLYPEGLEIVNGGFGNLLERTAMAFDDNGYSQGLHQLQQLGQLRQLLGDEKLQSISRGNELLKKKILEASKALKFEMAVEVTGRVNKIVHLYPEAEDIVLAGFKQLLSRTAMTFKTSGYIQGISRLQQLGQLKQLLEMDDRDLNDATENELLKLKVMEKVKSLEFETALELIEMISEIVHIYPEANGVVQSGFGELLDKVALTFEANGYGEGIKQLQELGQLKQQLEVDDSAVKESRRRLLLHLIGAAQSNMEMLDFGTGMKFVQDLNDVAKTYPEAKDGVKAGFESLLQRVVSSFEENKCSEGADQLQQLGDLHDFLGLDDRALRGLGPIVSAAKQSFQALELQDITDVLCKLSKVAAKFSDARECIDAGVQIVWVRFEDALEDGSYNTAASMLEEIGTLANTTPLADRCCRTGMRRLKKIADTSLDGDDFMVGVNLSKKLSKIDRVMAENDDALERGSDVIREQMEKRIRQRDYSGAADLIHKLLTEMTRSAPQAIEYARAGLKTVEQQMDNALVKRDHSDLISVMEHFVRLEAVLPEVSRCLDHVEEVLKKVIERNVETKDFDRILEIIEKLHESCPEQQRAQDCVQYGICLMGKVIEKPVPRDNFDDMTDVIYRLSQSSIPRAGDCARRGLKGFWKTTKHSIEEHLYADAVDLIRNMRRLAPDLPEAGDCVQLAFVALRVRLVKAVDKDKYEMAMVLLQQLSTLAEELPEAFECAQFGFEALQERIEKTIDEENHQKIMSQMRYLGGVSEDLPEVTELFALGFSALSEALSQEIEDSKFEDAVQLMEQLAGLGKEGRPEAIDCTRQGLFKFWGQFEDAISDEDYRKAVTILQHLGALANVVSEAEDGVQLGFEVLEEKFDDMIEAKDYDSAVSLMQDLSKLAHALPEASSCIQNGFQLLRERLVKISEEQDYTTARSLIAKLEHELPVADSLHRRATTTSRARAPDRSLLGAADTSSADESTCSQSAELSVVDSEEQIENLRNKIINSLDEKEYGACVDAMLVLSNMEQVTREAGETLVFGCNLVKDHLEMSIVKMNCTTVLEMLRILEKKRHRLPVIGECTRFGLQQLQRSVEQKVDMREYKLAIELIDLLCKLSQELKDAPGYTQGALDAAIQHMVLLREEAAASFEDLGYEKDSKSFTTLLQSTFENLEMVTATEELRRYCLKVENIMSGCITCSVRLVSGESFCSEQTRRVTELVMADLPELLVDAAYVQMFAGNEDNVVSTIERLLLLRRTLDNGPGATIADTALRHAFDGFHGFADGIASMAQSELLARTNLKSFESQVVLLTSLINGMLKLEEMLHGDERKIIEDLEHRRSRLFLRFEIEVADSLESLGNHRFPHYTKDDRGKVSSYIRAMRMTELQKHRDVLVACINSRVLANMVSSNVDVSSAERILSTFDKALEKSLDNIISQLEDEKAMIDSMPKTKAGLPASKDQVEALCRDVPKLKQEVEIVSKWPSEFYSMDSEFYMNRMKALDQTAKELTSKMDALNGIGFSSFISSLTTSLNVADYYSCISGQMHE